MTLVPLRIVGKRRPASVIAIAALGAAALFFLPLSCSSPITRTETGRLVAVISLPAKTADTGKNSSRYVHPDTRTLSVTVSADDMASITQTGATSDASPSTITVTLENVPIGANRTVLVKLMSDDGTVLALGSKTVAIKANESVTALVTPVPLTSLSFALGTKADGMGTSLNLADYAGKTLVYKVDLPAAGNYVANFTYTGNAGTRPVVSDPAGQLISVSAAPLGAGASSFTASAAGAFYVAVSCPAGGTGFADLVLTPDIQILVNNAAPGEVDFGLTGTTVNKALDSNLTLNAKVGFVSYQWYVNGIVLAGQTTNVISFVCNSAGNGGPAGMIAPGVNRVLLVVSDTRGYYYSTEVTVRIIQ